MSDTIYTITYPDGETAATGTDTNEMWQGIVDDLISRGDEHLLSGEMSLFANVIILMQTGYNVHEFKEASK